MDNSSRKFSIISLVFSLVCFCTALPVQAAPGGSLVEPVQLKKWIDHGYRTEKGERVVILDVVPTKADKDTWFAGDALQLKEQAVRKYGEHSPQYVLVDQLARKGMLGHMRQNPCDTMKTKGILK